MIVTIMIADQPDGSVGIVVREQGPKPKHGGMDAQQIGEGLKKALALYKLQQDTAGVRLAEIKTESPKGAPQEAVAAQQAPNSAPEKDGRLVKFPGGA